MIKVEEHVFFKWVVRPPARNALKNAVLRCVCVSIVSLVHDWQLMSKPYTVLIKTALQEVCEVRLLKHQVFLESEYYKRSLFES